MRKSLLFLIFIIISFSIQAQKDTVNIAFNSKQINTKAETVPANISIYPVPVRENFFTIRCDKDFSSVKITNIIGQDIHRSQYDDPLTITKIFLDNPKRGMYLVTITFSDGSRVVKKIMIERAE